MNNTHASYKNYNYTVTVTLTAPIISQASGGISHGIDAAMLRNRSNTPSLPGTLIRGNLRDSWQEFIGLGLLNNDKIKQWLGDTGGVEPNRGELYFDEY